MLGAPPWAAPRVPVYFYAEAATRSQRVRLPDIRKGEYEGLKDKMTGPDWAPDVGEARAHPTAGATDGGRGGGGGGRGSARALAPQAGRGPPPSTTCACADSTATRSWKPASWNDGGRPPDRPCGATPHPCRGRPCGGAARGRRTRPPRPDSGRRRGRHGRSVR